MVNINFLKELDIARAISRYRNERLEKDYDKFKLDRMLYHSIFRRKDQKIILFEQSMDKIDVKNIELLKRSKQKIINLLMVSINIALV